MPASTTSGRHDLCGDREIRTPDACRRWQDDWSDCGLVDMPASSNFQQAIRAAQSSALVGPNVVNKALPYVGGGMVLTSVGVIGGLSMMATPMFMPLFWVAVIGNLILFFAPFLRVYCSGKLTNLSLQILRNSSCVGLLFFLHII